MFLRDIDQDTIDAFAKQKGNRKGVHNSAGELLGRRKRRTGEVNGGCFSARLKEVAKQTDLMLYGQCVHPKYRSKFSQI